MNGYLQSYLGGKLNAAAYGTDDPNNPNNPNRKLGAAVPQNPVQDQNGVHPDMPNLMGGPNGGGNGTASNSQDMTGSAGGGGYNYDFTQTPRQNGFDYLGQGIGPSLDKSKPGSAPVAANPVIDKAAQTRNEGHSGF